MAKQVRTVAVFSFCQQRKRDEKMCFAVRKRARACAVRVLKLSRHGWRFDRSPIEKIRVFSSPPEFRSLQLVRFELDDDYDGA